MTSLSSLSSHPNYHQELLHPCTHTTNDQCLWLPPLQMTSHDDWRNGPQHAACLLHARRRRCCVQLWPALSYRNNDVAESFLFTQRATYCEGDAMGSGKLVSPKSVPLNDAAITLHERYHNNSTENSRNPLKTRPTHSRSQDQHTPLPRSRNSLSNFQANRPHL